jgi:competence protein ComEA
MSWHRFTDQLREYFTFTRKERNGITVLLVLLVISQGAILFTHYYRPTAQKADISAFRNEVMAFLKTNDSITAIKGIDVKSESNSISTYSPEYFDFNPNTASVEEWKKMGLNERTIHSIRNYLSKGGHFYKKEDLKKIYNLPEEQYELLESYIIIDEKNKAVYEEKKPAEKKISIVEVNSASKDQLMTLPNIGEKRAEQIIKYRSRLGGFIRKEQLAEVYSIPDSVYQSLLPYISLDPALVQYIKVNELNNDTLYHPYLKKNLLKLIINYRVQHGSYTDKTELRKLPLMTDSVYQKVEGYIRVE